MLLSVEGFYGIQMEKMLLTFALDHCDLAPTQNHNSQLHAEISIPRALLTLSHYINFVSSPRIPQFSVRTPTNSFVFMTTPSSDTFSF